ncbi:hypothetical protein KIPB_015668, partial [Kipferlia bialata]
EFADEHGCWRVLEDSYVSDDSGSGVVHIAPFFGEDDHRVGLKNGIIKADGAIVCPINETGHMEDTCGPFAGMYVKDADKHIIEDLKSRGRLLSRSQVVHSYPFCWRSNTPLVY